MNAAADAGMQGIIATGQGFVMARLPRPVPSSPAGLLVRVERIALNRGEWAFPWAAGQAAGWDASGVVVQSAADGCGPSVGTRVACWGFSGAWAQYRQVERDNVVALPDTLGLAEAAALPVVGLTALRCLRRLRLAPGQRLAVTGAAGGVGHVLVQLAQAAGLTVEAIVGREASRRWLQAHHPGIALAGAEPQAGPAHLDAIVDTVGGRTLVRWLPTLREQGRVLLVGAASGEPALIDTAALVTRRQALLAFDDYGPAGADLAELVRMIQAGHLRLQVQDGGDWSALLDGRAAAWAGRGKLSLRVPPR